MGKWLEGCEICNFGLITEMDKLIEDGLSERKAADQLAKEGEKKIGELVYTSKAILRRYQHHRGKDKPRDKSKDKPRDKSKNDEVTQNGSELLKTAEPIHGADVKGHPPSKIQQMYEYAAQLDPKRYSILSDLYYYWKCLNNVYFAGVLEPPLIRVGAMPKSGVIGTAAQYKGVFEAEGITISPKFVEPKKPVNRTLYGQMLYIWDILLHEMIHNKLAANNIKHDHDSEEFIAECKRITQLMEPDDVVVERMTEDNWPKSWPQGIRPTDYYRVSSDTIVIPEWLEKHQDKIPYSFRENYAGGTNRVITDTHYENRVKDVQSKIRGVRTSLTNVAHEIDKVYLVVDEDNYSQRKAIEEEMRKLLKYIREYPDLIYHHFGIQEYDDHISDDELNKVVELSTKKKRKRQRLG